jgi:chromosome segregation ATPase
MFQDKCQSKSRQLSRQETEIEKCRKDEAFIHFGLNDAMGAIKSIDEQIEALKEQKREQEEKIRDYTQGKDKEKRYNSYDSIKEGSPIQEFINAGIADMSKKKGEVWTLNQQLSNELWYAKDLEQAIEIMQTFQLKLDAISLDGEGE